ncbi:MAG: bifunctional hydroxymethylpyrimidine kinase/phosphomethylpyrimidine kinase [Tissierellia bacterium]|nr:bifunctional hydroxymethylpyrimidine kinase/phosphomethylpyrimidine kinase [Tissierellia bacterium]
MRKTVLTIAGSDCSGGAGIQADIKTIMANGGYAMSIITALTAQNTMGVVDIMETEIDFLEKQLKAVFEDIYPDSIKIGMLSSNGIIIKVAEKLKKYEAKNIVLDPVMVSTSGSKLLSDDAVEGLCRELFPLAKLITPNIYEAEILSEMSINSADDMLRAAKSIYERYGCPVLCKGGHSINDANDLLYDGEFKWFMGFRIENENTHGTGCTFSSAIATNLAKGYDIYKSIEKAKLYISYALSSDLNLGHGSGPLDHGYFINSD